MKKFFRKWVIELFWGEKVTKADKFINSGFSSGLNDAQYCEVVDKLRDAAYQHYLRRQTYEWKMCITIWTPLVATIGLNFTNHVSIDNVPLWVASAVILFIHWAWQKNLTRSNDIDLFKANEFTKAIEAKMGLSFDIERKGRLVVKAWSHKIYVLITMLLITISVYVNYNQLGKTIIILPSSDDLSWLEAKQIISYDDKQKFLLSIMKKQIADEKKLLGEGQNVKKVTTPDDSSHARGN